MKGLNLNGLNDYLALAVRRKWWIVVPFLALSSAVVVLTYMLPKMFVSETLILIRPRDVPEEFVKDLLASTSDQRLTAIEQTVLSRTNLLNVLREFEDRLPEYRNLDDDQKVIKLSNQIKINFQSEKRSGPQLAVTYFRISYRNRNPELAQKIAAKLTSLFIEQDNKAREDQVFGTTEFLSGELEKVTEQMKVADTKLKELRGRRRYELPDQLETNLRTLDRLGLQKQANAEALDRYATIRYNLERQLAETQPAVPRSGAEATLGVKGTLLDEYRKKLYQLKELRSTLTPKHPDVEALTLQLEHLKKELSPEDLTALDQESGLQMTGLSMPNPVFQNLTAQLQQVKTEFEIRERERAWIETEIGKYNQRVQNAPESEQEIAEVQRLNSDLNKQYDTLRKNLSEARLSESLESRQKGSQFVIVDPANYPLTPTKPAKPAIAMLGTLLSLAAGLGCAVVADLANQKVWTQSDVEHLLGATVLIEIPEIVLDSDIAQARKRRQGRILSSAAAVVAYSLCLYLLYVNQSSVMRLLDPVIQRLY